MGNPYFRVDEIAKIRENEDIEIFLKNPEILNKQKERIIKIVKNNEKTGFLSERNFLKYRLLCHFETDEFK